MDRFEANSIFRTILAERDIESREKEKLTDRIEAKFVCKGEVCTVNWKPMPIRADMSENKE